MAKRNKLSDDDIQVVCQQFLRSALGAPDSDISAKRTANLIAYNAIAQGDFAPPEISDRSDFVATDVADTVEGMLPQLMKIFVSSDDAVEFAATKQGGDDLAKTITRYINHLFYVRNDGLNVLYDWFKDALIQKVGFVQVWAEQEKKEERQVFQGLVPEQVAMLQQEGRQFDGEPMQDEHGITVTVKDEREETCIKVSAIAPHEMRIDATARWGAEPAIIGRVYMRRKFELEEDGFDTSEIPVASYRGWAEAIQELGDTSEWTQQDIHDSHRLVECADVYAQLDRDGDGVSEWLQIRMVGERIGVIDGKPAVMEVDDHPFAEICPIPRPHAYFGDCPADFAYAQQKLRTNLIRSLLDNVYLTVNQRTYINTAAGVNIDDLLENRPGGIVRGQQRPSDAIQQLVSPALGAPAYQMNDWVERWGENRTGFNRYSKGTDADALNKTAHGIDLLTAKADMRTELIARFFAQGVRKMFAKMLKLAVENQDQQEWFKVNEQWQPVNPSEWKDQYNVKINVGLGHGTNDQKLQRVMAMMPLMQVGLQTGAVGPENVSHLIRTAAQANEFKNVDEFAPEKPQGPPVQQVMQQAQEAQKALQDCQQQLQQASQENAQLKLANANKQAEMQLKAHELELKAQPGAAPDDSGAVAAHQLAAWKAEQDVEVAKYDAETRRMVAVANAQAKAAELEQQAMAAMQATTPDESLEPKAGEAPVYDPNEVKAMLADHATKMQAQVVAHASKPRKITILRDKEGNITGAQSE